MAEYPIGKRQRTGIGKVAVIKAGAGDHIPDQPLFTAAKANR